MTAPAEESRSGEKHFSGLAQVVRWLTEERPITGPDDVGFVAGAPRRTSRWTYGDPPSRPSKPDVEPDVLREVRIGPAPRCAVAGETIALSVSLINTRGEMYLGWPIKLEWSSSDPSIAKVTEYGVVQVHARGRVELTCTCQGITGSVLLTVVEPGVAAAGTITNVPLSGDNGKTAITPKGYVPPPGESLHGHYFYGVTGDYFSALGIPLREGRFLTSADSHRPERVCVVDEDFARRYWPKGGALGQRRAERGKGPRRHPRPLRALHPGRLLLQDLHGPGDRPPEGYALLARDAARALRALQAASGDALRGNHHTITAASPSTKHPENRLA
jgi:hypothetical protein